MKVTDFVSKDNFATMSHYRQDVLYYLVNHRHEPETYMFPIDVHDLDGATVNHTEKSVFLMRYIRKAIEDGTMVLYGK